MRAREARLLNPYFDLHARVSREPIELQLELRKKLIWGYAWAVPSEDAIRAIVDFAPGRRVLEIGAGTGYWAWLLGQAGADCLAMDLEPGQPPRWCPISAADASSAAAHADRLLFLCWPPCESELAAQSLESFRGHRLAYVGEAKGGRTASDAFFAQLAREWRHERTIEIPLWPGFSDQLDLYVRAP